MTEKKISLSNSEWVIMERLWADAPMTATELTKAMEEETGWAKSTTKTLLRRMEAKGSLRCEEGGKARRFFPAVARDQVVLAETESFLSRLYSGSLGLMVNTLIDQKSLTQEEIAQLRTILEKMDGDD